MAGIGRLAVIGPKPDRMGGYEPEAYARMVEFCVGLLKWFHPAEVVSGMSLGIEMAMAEAATRLGLPFTAAIPFEGQDKVWRGWSKQKYAELKAKAARTEQVSAGPFSSEKLQARDRWVTENVDVTLFLVDGEHGVARKTMDEAKRKGLCHVELWAAWLQFLETGKVE